MFLRASATSILVSTLYAVTISFLTTVTMYSNGYICNSDDSAIVTADQNTAPNTIVPISNPVIEAKEPVKEKSVYEPDQYTLDVRRRIKELKSTTLPPVSTKARPFLRAKSYYRIAPHYGLSTCIVEKSMCTLTQSIFCYLFDTEGFVRNNRSIPAELWEGRFCENRNEMHNTEEKRLLMPLNSPTIFIVREPVERFISAFTDKCINENQSCYNCTGDVLCAIEGFHKEIMTMNEEHWDVSVAKSSYVSQGYETQHMAPSNWQCDLYDDPDSFIFIKYGENPQALKTMFTKISDLFLAYGVEDYKIDYIMNSVTERTTHATKTSTSRSQYAQKIRSSPHHLKLLNYVYHYDNRIFGYEPL